MIPDNIIEDIKARNDIADVIGSYVTLKRAGSNMQGLCPFHNEKTPSFSVSVTKQIFKCFGCGVAGDVVTFVRRMENLEYVDALHFLAKRVGITIPEDDKGGGGVRKSRILEMNKAAARFFRSQLLTSSKAKEYALKRGLTQKEVNRFGLGYSGARGYELVDHLKSLGYTEDEMVQAKLVGRNEKGYYPFFRDRFMFPIFDVNGAVIGFGGRTFDQNNPTKYLNTPENPAFNKGRNLYALNYAKEHCGEFLILCEGYMDVIALHAAGFQNAVAALGTALTPEQAHLIKKYTNKVVLCYDGDGAGKKATDRANQILPELGIDVRVLRITGAKDPDEYIKAFGAEAFKRLLNGADTKFDYITKLITAKYDINTVEGKIKASKELCKEIAGVSSSVERELYMEKTAKLLGISKQSIESDVKKAQTARNKNYTASLGKQMQNKALGIGDKVNPEYSANPKAAAAEEALLGILMLYPEKRAKIASGEINLTEDDFVTAFNKRVFVELMRLHSEGTTEIGVLGAIFTQAEMERIYSIQMKRDGLDSTSDTVIFDNLYALKNAKASQETDLDAIIKAKLSVKKDDK